MSFPSRTTASCQLKRNQYDLRQLLAAVKNAEKGKLVAAEPGEWLLNFLVQVWLFV